MELSHSGAGLRGWARWVVVATVLYLSVGGVATAYGSAGTPMGQTQPAAPATLPDLQPFDAIGLPAGRATGVPTRLDLPAGTNLKHVHGGPTYVYVLSGSLDIVDEDGTQTTYAVGSFFSEPPGHIHTVRVAQGAQVFVLQFLPPGAEATVPVQ